MKKNRTARNLRAQLLGVFMLSCSGSMAGTDQTHMPDFAFGEATRKPVGYAEWCEREQEYCEPDNAAYEPRAIVYDAEIARSLDEVNRYWNKRIKPVPDIDHFGVPEVWDYPVSDDMGDCEDYVLAKRQNLIDFGFPRQSLLITVVRDRHDDGHAVLTVMTSEGMLVLDNQTDEILPWYKTGYKFVKTQNPANPFSWVQVAIPAPAGAGVAGLEKADDNPPASTPMLLRGTLKP